MADVRQSLPPPPPLPAGGPLPQRLAPLPVVLPPLPALPVAEHAATPSSPTCTAVEPSSPDSRSSVSSVDPLAELLAAECMDEHWLSVPSVDPMTVEFEALCSATLASPLSFPPRPAASPARGALAFGFGHGLGGRGTFCPSSLGPSHADAVPARDDNAVQSAECADGPGADGVIRGLFVADSPPIIAGSLPAPPRPVVAKKKAALPRRSERQARRPSATPAAQHATARLAKELGLIDNDDSRHDAAVVAALV